MVTLAVEVTVGVAFRYVGHSLVWYDELASILLAWVTYYGAALATLKRAGAEHKERQLAVRLHPEVALYLVEQEPNFLRQLEKQTGLELEVRDDPMMRLDEFRMMAKPAGRDVTELYAVA